MKRNYLFLISFIFLFSLISVSALNKQEFQDYNFNQKLNDSMIKQVFQPKDYGFKYLKNTREIEHTLEVNRYNLNSNWELIVSRVNLSYKTTSSDFISNYVTKSPKFAKERLKNDTIKYYKEGFNQSIIKNKKLQLELLKSNQIDLENIFLKW